MIGCGLAGDNDSSRLLVAIIDEGAIIRARLMRSENDGRDQLEYLRRISTRRNVSIRIIRLNAGLRAALLGMFTVFQLSDDIAATSLASKRTQVVAIWKITPACFNSCACSTLLRIWRSTSMSLGSC